MPDFDPASPVSVKSSRSRPERFRDARWRPLWTVFYDNR